MNRSFRVTRLRLGTSILFLGACLLLAALWVRSYWWSDSLIAHLQGVNSASIDSDSGEMRIAIVPVPREWSLESKEKHSRFGANTVSSPFGPVEGFVPWGPMISFPHWYLVLVSAVVAGLPWIRWRTLFRTRSRSNTIEPHYYGSLENAA